MTALILTVHFHCKKLIPEINKLYYLCYLGFIFKINFLDARVKARVNLWRVFCRTQIFLVISYLTQFLLTVEKNTAPKILVHSFLINETRNLSVHNFLYLFIYYSQNQEKAFNTGKVSKVLPVINYSKPESICGWVNFGGEN